MATGWRLVTFQRGANAPATGIVLGATVHELAGSGLEHRSVLQLLEDWDNVVPSLQQFARAAEASTRAKHSLSDVRLLAPVQQAPGLFCAGANYHDHVREMSRGEPRRPVEPFFFLKSPAHCMVGPDEPVTLPHADCELDWEAEIAVIIGREARHVSEAAALEYVAGYSILNDLSARDLMKRSDVSFVFDWLGQKVFPGSAPMGPWLTPAAAIADPQNLAIRLWVNDTLQQDSSSRQMIFSVAEQIAYLSRRITLCPGDVIATGTPAGVGRPRGLSLKAGDRMRIEIEGLGVLETPIVAARMAR